MDSVRARRSKDYRQSTMARIFHDEAFVCSTRLYPEAVVESDLEVVANPQLEVGEVKKGEDATKATATPAHEKRNRHCCA